MARGRTRTAYDDSYIYQLSLVLATAIVSFLGGAQDTSPPKNCFLEEENKNALATCTYRMKNSVYYVWPTSRLVVLQQESREKN